MLWIVSWSNLDGEWSVVSQRVLVTPHWIGDHQIKGHKYPTIYTQIRTNIPLLIHKYSTTNAQIPNQLYTNTVTNTQPLLLRLSCIPCTNILRPHLEMNGTDSTNSHQYLPIGTNIWKAQSQYFSKENKQYSTCFPYWPYPLQLIPILDLL